MTFDGSNFTVTNFTGSKQFQLYQGITMGGLYHEVDSQTGVSPLVFSGDVDTGYFFADPASGLFGPTSNSTNIVFSP